MSPGGDDKEDDGGGSNLASASSAAPPEGAERRAHPRRIPKLRVNAMVTAGGAAIDGYVYDFSEVSVALFLARPVPMGQVVQVEFDDGARKATFDMTVVRCDKAPSKGRVIKVANHDYKAALTLTSHDPAEGQRYRDYILPTA